LKKGIDVSTFQGYINWQKVKNDGVKFAMLRGGYGRGGLDARFEQNYKNATSAGVPVGVYHYSYATTVERAREEAKFCLSYLKGKKLPYPVAYDVEDKTQMSLSKKQLTDIIYTFCDEVEKNGYFVCIYSSKSFLTDRLDMNRLKRFDIWVAQWNKVCTYKGSYGMWQYSNKGKVDGISGNVDLDKAYKDYPSIMKKYGLNGYGTEPDPDVPVVKEYKKGDAVTLKKAPLYISASAKTPSNYLTGKYYIYDGVKINGRYRITNAKKNVGRLPMINYVTGWVELK
jgi:GH25 family lysozyme M1 (1,4-beta-N-acetylmuramidase)